MTTDETTETLGGIEMTETEIEQFLTEQGHGILALADDADAYGVPISFGYDGEWLYTSLLEFGDESQKLAYLDETDTACLTTYQVSTRFDWKSVVVRGTVRQVNEDDIEYMDDVLDENAWFPTIFPPSDPMTGVRHLALVPEEMTGRKGQAYQ
ncbi:Nitroimidazol reductase NimA, pyridoxamine 5'-phosphate oxidase superfamily [Halovenus aranensis]|jgi:nitroimidazol reductase NimA-like FMN-containing flavoprotein (pyridoxamine 5'-phosphate oxidase superfamily)|uniref:Nitroimidazol reductase NimA, pyridoxamine 5'-phosphate oxidase superfamily n=1 Tax=Halovenus aranensis TaxID=890420 RepID=A0A1G8YMP0_9EURY|nr:pyridoxamine 5'-phosphate oxidase family protein [Halovenus aranensis]SDK03714.1 Nitroimidazol reductase NimA, pyridoxamine 5'-phosphate oxidase superfamily [Halovenus aranensis]